MSEVIAKQQLLINYLCSSPDVFNRVSGIINDSYFEPELRKPIAFITEYYQKYSAIPTPEQVHAESGFKPTLAEFGKHEVDYATSELEQFCKRKAIERAILSAPALLAAGDHGKIEQTIKDALAVGITRNLGLDYFKDPEQRLQDMLMNMNTVPTNYIELDNNLNGGLNRRELTLICANSGGGKSLIMANLAVQFLEQGLNVAYISLELSEAVVAKRFDSMITGYSQGDIFKHIKAVSAEVQMRSQGYGNLTIKRMPEGTTNCNHIRMWLKEYYLLNGHYPDVLISDYLDIMASNQKIASDNMFIKDKFVTEELRSIMNDFDMIGLSAAQLGRGALDNPDLHQGNIQGGMSKVNTCDNMLSVIHNEALRAQGQILLKFTKTRSSGGIGKTVTLKWDPVSLRVMNMDDVQKGAQFSHNKSSGGHDKKAPPKRDLNSLIKV